MYDIQQTALFWTMINIQRKDTLQICCDSFGFLRTEVAKSVRSLGRSDRGPVGWCRNVLGLKCPGSEVS